MNQNVFPGLKHGSVGLTNFTVLVNVSFNACLSQYVSYGFTWFESSAPCLHDREHYSVSWLSISNIRTISHHGISS